MLDLGCEELPAPRTGGAGERGVDVVELSISEMRAISSESLTRAYLARIDAIDRAGPTLRSMIEVNPDALAIAKSKDREPKKGVLHGIPVVVKDNIETGDRQLTSAGALALASQATKDARVVAKLREAGAVILGKTNLSEWANARSEHSTSGWSGRGGLTKNPYVLDRNASGSSSGSAVAMAASFAAAAIGTETAGSITSPASACGIVGLKATHGLVSIDGVIPCAHSFDCAGPMARTVTDVAIVLSAIAEGEHVADYLAALRIPDLKGTRIGVVRFEWMPDAVAAMFEQALGVLKGLGAELVDDVKLGSERDLWKPGEKVLLHELGVDVDRYLAARGGPMRSLADVIAFDKAHAAEELKWFGDDYLEKAIGKGRLSDAEYAAALAETKRIAKTEGIDKALGDNKVDALVSITQGPIGAVDLVLGDRGVENSASFPALAGTPHLTVPCGFIHELPVGISFMGPAWSEAKLLGMGRRFEEATKARRPPKMLPTLR